MMRPISLQRYVVKIKGGGAQFNQIMESFKSQLRNQMKVTYGVDNKALLYILWQGKDHIKMEFVRIK